MEEQKINEAGIGIGEQPITGAGVGATGTAQAGVASNLPKEVSIWGKIKAFLLQDVNRDVVITMTPHQEKVLKEVHDFWFQEINFGKVKDFLFQEITFGSKKSK